MLHVNIVGTLRTNGWGTQTMSQVPKTEVLKDTKYLLDCFLITRQRNHMIRVSLVHLQQTILSVERLLNT